MPHCRQGGHLWGSWGGCLLWVVGVVYWMGGVRRLSDCGHRVVIVMVLVEEKKQCHML